MTNDAVAEMRAMWEFAATWKALKLLSRPLSFSMPGPGQLESALLNPADHLALIANLHGRLLGLSAGTSSAKKWVRTTARFVRTRPDEFWHVLEDAGDVRDAKEEDEEQHSADTDQQLADAEPQPAFSGMNVFPADEEGYADLKPATRLLVLHTIADIVISEHDTLLSAGSIAEWELPDLRLNPVGKDAAGNNYFYFGDLERVYREPGKQTTKSRQQLAEELRIQKVIDAARKAKKEKEERRAEIEKKKEENKRKREERKRKSMEKWAPRVAARRSTRASRRLEKSVLERKQSGGLQLVDDAKEGKQRRDTGSGAPSHEATNGATAGDVEIFDRRTSGRRRKASTNEPASGSGTAKIAKRPRKSEVDFADPTLRECSGWEVLTVDTESLRVFINRFGPRATAASASERALLRCLEEDILPLMEERDLKARREREKKSRTEFLLTHQKRSSRVQALEQKREEEAKKMAAEEEKIRLESERKEQHALAVQAKIAVLEKEQSRDIRVARRLHNLGDVIRRDEEVERIRDAQNAKARAAKAAVGTRSRRISRRLRTGDMSEPPEHSEMEVAVATDDEARGSELHCDSASNLREGISAQGSLEVDADLRRVQTITRDDGSGEDGDSDYLDIPQDVNKLSGPINDEPLPSVDAAQAEIQTKIISRRPFSSGLEEEAVESSFTWLDNPEDALPIRVLDKFFFASTSDFSDAPLEKCDEQNAEIVGLGILVPPFGSKAHPVRVEVAKVDDWVIEYGETPRLWIKSCHAWYELRGPALEYDSAFKSSRRKYELCVRISILGHEMRAAQLTYDEVVDLLSLRYEDMLAYDETDILQEKRFIRSQMEVLNKKSLMDSGFMRELQKRLRAEDRKMAAALEKAEREQQEGEEKAHVDSRRFDAMQIDTDMPAEIEKPQVSKISMKKAPRRNSSVGGRVAVPRAVSTIISSVLRAAMKARGPPRKRKRRLDPLDDTAIDATRIPKLEPQGESHLPAESSNDAQQAPISKPDASLPNATQRSVEISGAIAQGETSQPLNVNTKVEGMALNGQDAGSADARDAKRAKLELYDPPGGVEKTAHFAKSNVGESKAQGEVSETTPSHKRIVQCNGTSVHPSPKRAFANPKEQEKDKTKNMSASPALPETSNYNETDPGKDSTVFSPQEQQVEEAEAIVPGGLALCAPSKLKLVQSVPSANHVSETDRTRSKGVSGSRVPVSVNVLHAQPKSQQSLVANGDRERNCTEAKS